ncbi:hypothetical protein [Polaribacter gangjinensis]|uniref:Uncharacterized protein n=1 Tax=Polaribacter gangjinensis TaxID=574710 RepID=A0A2S7WA41_9FLAO|nr:hypothetical protein [Polaribacter gangjinensis]PQJ74510.1 hypothetical protein BTO13_04185 [Polaribacter gangjinensis]
MDIKALQIIAEINTNSQLQQRVDQFENLLSELRKKALTESLVVAINKMIDEINGVTTEKELQKVLRKMPSRLMQQVEKEAKIVPKFYYRNLWMALGMSAFGIPMGVVFGLILKNMAFLGIGLPIGMSIGIAVGTAMDKKALDEGRQLDIVIK